MNQLTTWNGETDADKIELGLPLTILRRIKSKMTLYSWWATNESAGLSRVFQTLTVAIVQFAAATIISRYLQDSQKQ